jgi:hypothetical protein
MKRESSLGFAVCLLALACNKEAPPAAEEPQAPLAPPAIARTSLEVPTSNRPAANPAAGDQPGVAEPAAASRVSDATFDLSLRPKGEYVVGKPGEVELVLKSKDPYHVNDKYPFKFTLKQTKGLKFPSAVLGADRIKLEKSRAALAVPFTPEVAGTHTVSGRFAFSVCSDDKCLMEKRELSLSFAAK